MSYAIDFTQGIADYEFRGGPAAFIEDHSPEVIVEGPAETGKTVAACMKLHICASKYSGAQIVIARKIQADIYGSVMQTFERIVDGAPINRYGGDQKPERYIYPNGSVIWLAGLDKPGKVLSSEKDIIYVNQAEELKLDSWETITTRTTGRGAVMPYTQTIGDCNPAGSKHWIPSRAKEGKLSLIQSFHQDNPTLYDQEGNLTAQGVRTMETLTNLTGVRRKRLLEGKWATAEGAVYDMFDHSIHVVKRHINEFKEWYLCLDEGYTNPAVILVVGIDGDKRAHIFSEFYQSGVLQGDVVKRAKEYCGTHKVKLSVVDSAAAGLVADLLSSGINAVGHKGQVIGGIYSVQDRLAVQGDGKPRLTVDPSCVETINEFESYTWRPGKDEPVKDYDHAMDAIRYLIDFIDVYEAGPLMSGGLKQKAKFELDQPDGKSRWRNF